MSEEHRKINYDLAKAEADKVDEQIIAALQNGISFRVEAGAGSGKTYSLNKAIEWIQANKWTEYHRKKQTVVCITYTNAAVDVIAERLSKDSFILPSTIHSFAWNAIKAFSLILSQVTLTSRQTKEIFSKSQKLHIPWGIVTRKMEFNIYTTMTF